MTPRNARRVGRKVLLKRERVIAEKEKKFNAKKGGYENISSNSSPGSKGAAGNRSEEGKQRSSFLFTGEDGKRGIGRSLGKGRREKRGRHEHATKRAREEISSEKRVSII